MLHVQKSDEIGCYLAIAKTVILIRYFICFFFLKGTNMHPNGHMGKKKSAN